MTMINVLFYLLLLLAGSAVALILADLERAEVSARQALALLEAGPAPGGPGSHPHAACRPAHPPALHPAPRAIREPAVRPLQAPASITLADLHGPAAAAPSCSGAGPSFDFALACGTASPRPDAPAAKKGQAVSGLPAARDCQEWNCCA